MKVKNLFENNEIWINEKLKGDPDYFKKLSKDQVPKYLMVSCSDSRVPLDYILKSGAGEIFIHRNIANQVNLNDLNFLSVLEFSIQYLFIRHIIVVGHYKCGGIEAAVDGVDHGLLENWVAPVQDLYKKNIKILQMIENYQERMDRLSELNAIEQAVNIIKTPIYQRALKRKQFPKIHSWIFDIYTGKIIDLDLNIDKLIEEGLLPDYYKIHIETNKTYYE